MISLTHHIWIVDIWNLYIQCIVGFRALGTFLLHIHTMMLVYPWAWYANGWNGEISCKIMFCNITMMRNAWVCVCVHAEKWYICHIVLDSIFTYTLENDLTCHWVSHTRYFPSSHLHPDVCPMFGIRVNMSVENWHIRQYVLFCILPLMGLQ